MKKLLFVMMALFAITVNAAVVDVYMVNGKRIEGMLVEQNDSVLIIRSRNMPDGMFLNPQLVQSFTVSGIGRYVVEGGKFVLTPQSKAEKEKKEQKVREKAQRNRVLAADPNEVIGKAFKNTGSVCMGVGVPALVAGTILVAVGNTSGSFTWDATEKANEALIRGKLATAGYVLMPFGAALTIVGIPLYIHGKRIAELNFNYTGNGAGLSMSF